mgnify:CR=1 FL=1
MGGNAKRMSFIHENLSLTFGKMFDIYQECGLGKRSFIEKFDGVNLFFRYDSSSDTIRFSRNKSHLKIGGMTEKQFRGFFSGHPAEKQFYAAISFICRNKKHISLSWNNHVTRNLPDVPEEKIYVNLDYLDPNFHQTLKYDCQAIAMHNVWVFNNKWENDRYLNGFHFSRFSNEIEKNSPDAIYGQVEVKTPPMVYTDIVNMREELRKEVERVIPHDSSLSTWEHTIENYVRFQAIKIASEKCLISDQADLNKFADILLGYGKRNDLRDFNKKYSKVRETTNSWISSQRRVSTILKLLLPLTVIGEKFGSKMLEGISSSKISYRHAEEKRLGLQMDHSIRLVGESITGSWKNMSGYLKRYREASCGIQTIEGVVFNYEGNIYKITGSFSTMNRIIGEARY